MLKPCPFCGSQKGVRIFESENLGGWYAECQNSYCMFQPSGSFETKQEATVMWNNRPQVKHIASEILKMVKADAITMSRAAEILGITVSEARRIYNKGEE
jgi:hypothetical protein